MENTNQTQQKNNTEQVLLNNRLEINSIDRIKTITVVKQYGSSYCFLINKDIRVAMDLKPGDVIHLTIERAKEGDVSITRDMKSNVIKSQKEVNK